jgi:hypothetical protein
MTVELEILSRVEFCIGGKLIVLECHRLLYTTMVHLDQSRVDRTHGHARELELLVCEAINAVGGYTYLIILLIILNPVVGILGKTGPGE